MSTIPEPSKSESTYFIKDSGAEIARLLGRERFFARILGGLLPEHPDESAFLAPFQRVLDVACGSGGWVLELAQRYPHLEVEGIDIDTRAIRYADALVHASNLDNVSFGEMDARQPLAFPDNSFDLVNARFLVSIGASAMPGTVRELFRITNPGGFIRITETEDYSNTTGPAFEKLSAMFLQAEKLAGFSFSPTGRTSGQTVILGRLLRDVGCQNVQKYPTVIEWSAGTEAYEPMIQYIGMWAKALQPFLIKMGLTTQEESDQLYREADIEMMSDDFCALMNMLTVWGQKPRS